MPPAPAGTTRRLPSTAAVASCTATSSSATYMHQACTRTASARPLVECSCGAGGPSGRGAGDVGSIGRGRQRRRHWACRTGARTAAVDQYSIGSRNLAWSPPRSPQPLLAAVITLLAAVSLASTSESPNMRSSHTQQSNKNCAPPGIGQGRAEALVRSAGAHACPPTEVLGAGGTGGGCCFARDGRTAPIEVPWGGGVDA